jgi:predicted nucleic acid-binding protein
MAAVLLDTTVLIDVLRGRPATVAKLRGLREGGDVPCTSAINVEEVVRGLRPSEVGGAQRLFAGLAEAPLGFAEGRRAGEWRRRFARRGRTLSQADCLIAAAALVAGARLATGNPQDFPMMELTMEHWPVGD